MSTIRLAFIGVGMMGQCAHLRNYAVDPAVEIVAIADLRPRLREQVARRYGVPRTYADHRELLAAERVDAVVAIQQPDLHGTLVPELIAHGKPLLIEKPLARWPANAQRILDALAQRPTPLWLGYHKRSDPAVAHARALIDRWRASGEVGQLRHVRIACAPGDWTAGGGFADLIRTDEAYDGLTAWDPKPTGLPPEEVRAFEHLTGYWIHQINLLAWLMGEPYEVDHADAGGRLLVARGRSGTTGVLELGTHQTTVDWQEEAFIAFERGWIRVEVPAPMETDRAGRVTVFHDPGGGATPTTTVPSLPRVHAMRQQARHFVEAVRGEPTPLCTAPEAFADLAVASRFLALSREASCR